MNTKIIIAAVVGAIAAFLLGWIIWGVLLMDYFVSNTIQYEGLMINPPILWAIFLSGLAVSVLLAFLFEKMNIFSIADGFKYGVIVYFCFAFSISMFFYASMNWYNGITVIVVDVLVNTIYGGLIGAVIAAMLGRGQSKVTN